MVLLLGPVLLGRVFTCVQDLSLLSAAVVVVVSEVPQQWDGGYHFGVTNHRASTTLKCYKSWTPSSVFGRRLEIWRSLVSTAEQCCWIWWMVSTAAAGDWTAVTS